MFIPLSEMALYINLFLLLFLSLRWNSSVPRVPGNVPRVRIEFRLLEFHLWLFQNASGIIWNLFLAATTTLVGHEYCKSLEDRTLSLSPGPRWPFTWWWGCRQHSWRRSWHWWCGWCWRGRSQGKRTPGPPSAGNSFSESTIIHFSPSYRYKR